MKNIVVTEQSIITLAYLMSKEIIKNGEIPNSEKYYKISIFDDTDVILTGNAKDKQIDKLPFIIIDRFFFEPFENDINSIAEALLEIQSLAVRYHQNKNLLGYIPSKAYCKGNRIVLNIGHYHVFVVVNTNNTGAFFVFKVTTSKNEHIEDSTPNMSLFNSIVESKEEIARLYSEQMIEKKVLIENDINFNIYFSDKNQQNYSYEDWLSKLTNLQKAFLNKPTTKAIKLRGPAGTGKTLAMELKAIKLIRENPDVRILFTCHSWAVAFQVSDFISNIDFNAGLKIDAIPLLALAESKVPQSSLDCITLGDDSFSGKVEQIKLLNSIILDYQKSDWKILENGCSEGFRNQFNQISSKNNNFTWDIMIEITCIIMANGFMPIDNDFPKYLDFERRNWMLALPNTNDKKTVFSIYKLLLEKLEKENKITTAQIINDYINILTTFSWFRLRKSEGYDYIFVDEMQLFNAQEKAILQYLTRNPEKYPVLIMAMDPKQAVEEVYSDFGVTSVFDGMNPEIEREMGNPEDICLTEAFRYSGEILRFLKHIDSCYPVYDFGKDWNNNIKNNSSKQEKGPIPSYIVCKDKENEVECAISKAIDLSGNCRVAILSLQDDIFSSLIKKVNNKQEFKIIESTNVTHTLKYAKRNIFVSKPSYVIGLQFDVVILIGCYSIFPMTSPNQSCYERKFLSDMYLGASRSRRMLFLYSNRKAPTIPHVITTALANGFIIEEKK